MLFRSVLCDVTTRSFRWAHAAPLADVRCLCAFPFFLWSIFLLESIPRCCFGWFSVMSQRGHSGGLTPHRSPMFGACARSPFFLWSIFLLESIPGCCFGWFSVMSQRGHSGGLTPHRSPMFGACARSPFFLWSIFLLESIPGCCFDRFSVMSQRGHSGGLTPHRSPMFGCEYVHFSFRMLGAVRIFPSVGSGFSNESPFVIDRAPLVPDHHVCLGGRCSTVTQHVSCGCDTLRSATGRAWGVCQR